MPISVPNGLLTSLRLLGNYSLIPDPLTHPKSPARVSWPALLPTQPQLLNSVPGTKPGASPATLTLTSAS